MKQQPRIYYTETDKTLMWDRWQKGESQSSIAAPFWSGPFFSTGAFSVRRVGYVPAQKRRSRTRANIVRT